MNLEAGFIFIILLIGLAVSTMYSPLEGFNDIGTSTGSEQSSSNPSGSGASTGSKTSGDNYNHFTGTSTELATGTTFYSDGGQTATVSTNSDGTQSLQIVLPGSNTPVLFSSTKVEGFTSVSGTITKFYGPNGAIATILTGDNGQQFIKVSTATGTYYYNTSTHNSIYNPSNVSNHGQYNGPHEQINGPNVVQGPNGNTAVITNGQDLGQGIPRSQIPLGDEDLYILKTQVVPPVCPACPSMIVRDKAEKCPPCPACERCPEPSFECKKVPNYSSINSNYLPIPVLNDFSTFGM